MNNISAVIENTNTMVSSESIQLVTFLLGDQIFGVSALKVQDILRQQRLTRIPLSPPEIAGTLNLRGHIVTAIDLRARLGLNPRPEDAKHMCVVVEEEDDHYCLIVDGVGDVHSILIQDIEPNPTSLPSEWAEVSRGIHRLDNRLLIVADTHKLLNLNSRAS